MDEITEFEWLDPDRVDAVKGPANGTPFLMLKSADETVLSEDGAIKYVSAAARRKYAESGVAMPNGDFPIPNEGHLRSAIGRLAEYNGDRTAAKRHIVKRAKALGLTHLLPHDWHVSKMTVPSQEEVQGRMEGADTDESLSQTRALGEDEVVHMDNRTAEGTPQAAHYHQPRPNEHTGFGDTAPDKSLHRDEALSQTTAKEIDHRGMGDSTPPPHESADEEEAEREARSQTEETAESKKGKKTRKGRVIEVTNPASKSGKKAKKSIRRAAVLLSGLADGSNHQTAIKELADMTPEELEQFLNDRDARKAKEYKRATKEAAKKEAKRAEKAAKKAAKSAEATGEATKSLEERLAALERTPAGARPAISGHADPSARPVLRGQDASASGAGVFKALDDKVEEARKSGTREDLRAAAREAGIARLAANLGAQVPDQPALALRRTGGMPMPIFRSTPESDRLALASVGSGRPSGINRV